MALQRYDIVLCRREPQQLTLDMLAARAGMHPALVEQFRRVRTDRAGRMARREVTFRCFGGPATAHDRTAARIFGYQPRGRCGHSGFA